MKASEVFTPGRFPSHTFVDEHLADKKQQLLDTLDAGAMLISISGPSKSGKTVFVEESLGRDNLVQITGAGVSSPVDLWMRVFDMIGTNLPKSITSTVGSSTKGGGSVRVEANAIIAKGAGTASIEHLESTSDAVTASIAADCLNLLIKELGGSDLVLFIDDFHYIPIQIQQEVARQIKEAIRNNVRFICASVPYHADDVIRGNPDLRGRVFSIDFQYWGTEVLKQIARKGFPLLGIDCTEQAIGRLAAEAAGSPQLMQYLCLNSCYELNVRETADPAVHLIDDNVIFEGICKRTVQSTDYGSIVEKMKEGPKTRGSARTVHTTKFGWNGDSYRLLVKALSLDPPQLTFRYASLNDRMISICTGDPPSGSSITNACAQSAKIVNDAAADKIVEWDETSDVFDIRDPYLLFYLRWSDTTDS
jgi:hypothetical protein